MKRTVIITMLVLLMTLYHMAEARNVDTVAVKALAERFLSAKGVRSELQNITPVKWEGMLYLYANGQGYVLMSADDAVRPILAYSANGTFPTDNIPPQVQALVQPYADIVEKRGRTTFRNIRSGKSCCRTMRFNLNPAPVSVPW